MAASSPQAPIPLDRGALERLGMVKNVTMKLKDSLGGLVAKGREKIPFLKRDNVSGDPLMHVLSQRKPWNEVLDTSSFSRPSNLAEATQRIRKNLAYFRINYFIFIFLVAGTLVLMNPGSILVMAILAGMWLFLFVLRQGNLEIAGRSYSPKEQMVGASTVTVLTVFFFSNLGSLLFSALTISVLGIALHGAFRTPDDLFLEEGPAPGDQGMLGGLIPAQALVPKGPSLV